MTRKIASQVRVPARQAIGGLAVVATVAATLLAAGSAQAATSAQAPTAMTSTTGSTGAGQTVANLAVKNQSGSQDGWSKYVEFSPSGSTPYSGYRTYTLPSGVASQSVTGLDLSVNYKGPDAASQTWTWSLYDWATSAWTAVGTNAGAPSWGSWKTLDFTGPSATGDHISATGEIRVRLTSNNASDSADVDYESLTVTHSGGSGSSAIVLPAANAQFDYQLGGAYTPMSSVGVVSRDRTEAPATGKYNICYVNLLQSQPDDESDVDPTAYGTTAWWKAQHPDLLLKDADGDYVQDTKWSEIVFDVRTQAKRDALFAIQQDWFDDCAADGFDAIEPDNLDTYTRSAGLMTFADDLAYLRMVVPYVHGLNLAIAQKNVNGEFADLEDSDGVNGSNFVTSTSPAQGFDFALAEECAAYEECGQYAAVYGSLFYEVEYTDNNPNQTRSGVTKTAYQWACQDRGSSVAVILRDRDVTVAGDPAYHYEYC